MTTSDALSESDDHAYRQLVAWCARIERRRRMVAAHLEGGAAKVTPSLASPAPAQTPCSTPAPTPSAAVPAPTKVA
jgi:hypothetical protein